MEYQSTPMQQQHTEGCVKSITMAKITDLALQEETLGR